MLALLASLALGAPDTGSAYGQTHYELRHGDELLDGWEFANLHDPRTRTYMRGRVYGRRLAFLAATFGMPIVITGSLIDALDKGFRPGHKWLIASTSAIGAFVICWAAVDRGLYLSPPRHWTLDETRRLAQGISPGHGLQIIDVDGGWAVINRAGRALNAVEVAAKLGDRATRRRARGQSTLDTLLSSVFMLSGYAILSGGIDLVTYQDPRGSRFDRDVEGVLAISMGTVALGTGLFRFGNRRRKAPARYWDRATLQQLIELEP